jgi:ribonucleoside-diphosphate reductase alpha chain
LKDEHLPVFDCSFQAATGTRTINYQGHLTMMAAAQPFISGAISKTINLPADATKEEVADAFMLGWKLGLKAIAVYRDGSKGVQPLNTKKEEPAPAPVPAPAFVGYSRVRLPDERPAVTHKFSVGGYEAYMTVGLYPDTKLPGELFLVAAKEGSTVSGLMDTIATLVSMCLQSGMPLKTLVRKFKDMSFARRFHQQCRHPDCQEHHGLRVPLSGHALPAARRPRRALRASACRCRRAPG